jgi:hypothetical protein
MVANDVYHANFLEVVARNTCAIAVTRVVPEESGTVECNEGNACTIDYAESFSRQLDVMAEQELLDRQARAYRCRDLSYVYRPKLIPRLLFILRVPPIVFQPCWSSRRWKSLT